MKTSELKAEGTLNWGVAMAEGWIIKPNTHRFNKELIMIKGDKAHEWFADYNPSTNWSQGGPIIEQEGITITHHGNDWKDAWSARKGDGHWKGEEAYGPTPLIAAMRCYVASKLGDEVEIPEELKWNC